VIGLSLGFLGLRGAAFYIRTGGGSTVLGPEFSFLEANNTFGLALVMNVPLLFYLAKLETKPWLARGMQGMMVVSDITIIGTFSRGAWVGLAAVTGLLVVKNRPSVLKVVAVGTVALIASLMFTLTLPDPVQHRWDSLVNYEEDGSAQSRFWNWEFCTRVALGRPLGGGFNLYSEESYALYMPEFAARWPGKVWSCHNMWLSVWAEHGYPGAIVWLGLLLSCLIAVRRMRKYGSRNADAEWAVDYCNMVEISLVGYMVSGTFIDMAYFELYYHLVAVVIVLKELVWATPPPGGPSARPAVGIASPKLGQRP